MSLTASARFHFFGGIQESNGLANTKFDLLGIILVIVLIDHFLQIFITDIIEPRVLYALFLKFILSGVSKTQQSLFSLGARNGLLNGIKLFSSFRFPVLYCFSRWHINITRDKKLRKTGYIFYNSFLVLLLISGFPICGQVGCIIGLGIARTQKNECY